MADAGAVQPRPAARRRKRGAQVSVWLWLGPTLGVAAVSLIIIGSLLVAIKTEREQRYTAGTKQTSAEAAPASQPAAVRPAASVVAPKPAVTPAAPAPSVVGAAQAAKKPPPKAGSASAVAKRDLLREASLVLSEAEEAYAAGDWSNALASYQQVLSYQSRAYGEHSGELLPVLARMTICAHRLGDEDALITYFTRYAQSYSPGAQPDAALTKPVLDIARHKAKARDEEAADRYFQWALTLSKDTPSVNWMARAQYAGHLRQIGQIEQAQAIAPLPNRPRRFFNRGN